MFNTISDFERIYIKNNIDKLFDKIFSTTTQKIFTDAFYEDDFIKIIYPFVDRINGLTSLIYRDFYKKYQSHKSIDNTDCYCFCVLPSIHQKTVKISCETRTSKTTFEGFDKDFMIHYVFIEMPIEKRNSTIFAIRDAISEFATIHKL